MYDTLKIHSKGNYAVVEIDNGKVNAISRALSRDLDAAFTTLAKDDEVMGVILTGRPNCFSAGLDVNDLAAGGVEGAKDFWRAYLGGVVALAKYPKPLIAAITGYAPAGATTLTLCCDYRIMAKGAKHVVGMHEFKMSLLIPEMMGDIYAYHLGERRAWEAVQGADLFNSDQALAIGLVNESVEVDEVMERAEKRMKRYLNIVPSVYAQAKLNFRKGLLKIVNQTIDEMMVPIEENLNAPETQMMIQMFVAQLKK